jgi:5-methylcytosine-specific restriction endonuclease McrA
MRIELWILLISGLLIYDVYYDNKYSKLFFSYKKYYKIILIGIGSIFVYYLFKKKPDQFKNLIQSSNDLFRQIPLGRKTLETMDIMNPIFNLTNTPSLMNNFMENNEEIINNQNTQNIKNIQNNNNNNRQNNDNGIIKRNVSETKKRYVASSQNWCCGNCKNQLSYTYEIDHNIALKDGGDNSVENLIALCRECHGRKTAQSFLK